MLSLLAAITLAAYPTPTDDPYINMIRPPAMDISAVRQIACDGWTGSGFLIGNKIMATANHVMDGGENCIDVASGSPIHAYKTDKAHDLALVTGPELPTDIPYVKISCAPFKTGDKYIVYGITGYGQRRTIVRNNVLTATKNYTDPGFKFDDGTPIVGARVFLGYEAPGMSGGPIADVDGYAHAVVTGGNGTFSFHFEFTGGMLCPAK